MDFKLRRIVKLAAVFCLGIVGFGCTQPYIVNTAIEYNKSLAQYISEEILLNAVRASKRAPLSFSAIGDYTGQARKTGRLSGLLTFALNPATVFQSATHTPLVEGYMQDGTSFANLNADKFVKRMQQPIDPQNLDNYLSEGWPEHLLFAVMVKEVRFKSSVYARWAFAAKLICELARHDKSSFASKRPVCDAIRADLEEIAREADRTRSQRCIDALSDVTIDGGTLIKGIGARPDEFFHRASRFAVSAPHIRFSSSARTKCGFLKFKIFLHGLSLLEYQRKKIPPENEFEFATEKKTTIVGQDEGYRTNLTKKEIKVSKKSGSFAYVPTLDYLGGKIAKVDSELIDKRDSGVFVLRSPEAMIYFLGQLVAAQNYNPLRQGYEPTIHVYDEYYEVELFNVVRGRTANAVVSVADDEGEVFSIPKPNYGSEREDRSLHVLNLISQIIALQTVTGDLPKPATITVNTN